MNTIKKVLLFLLPLVARSSSAFAPVATKRTFVTKSPVTQLHATPPTMVVYWTIKSSIDLASYGLGMSDKFKGTGVWSGVEFERPQEKDESPPAEKKEETAKPSK
jgi:hypothetical protein